MRTTLVRLLLSSCSWSSWVAVRQVLAAIPEECFERDTARSMGYALLGVAMTALCAIFAYQFIPLTAAAIPAWVAYALVTGTVATGPWVVAHECGHGAFSDNKLLQDTVGYASGRCRRGGANDRAGATDGLPSCVRACCRYVLHSALLVPYFSWQRSHAVHHSRTNHMTEGETHVPEVYGEGGLQKALCAIREVRGWRESDSKTATDWGPRCVVVHRRAACASSRSCTRRWCSR
eukprot:scaffold1549_cov350-Prasinococcus_capsulatus_cf.AAC.25